MHKITKTCVRYSEDFYEDTLSCRGDLQENILSCSGEYIDTFTSFHLPSTGDQEETLANLCVHTFQTEMSDTIMLHNLYG